MHDIIDMCKKTLNSQGKSCSLLNKLCSNLLEPDPQIHRLVETSAMHQSAIMIQLKRDFMNKFNRSRL